MSQVLRPKPNAVLRDGSRDGQLVHFPHSEEPNSIDSGTGEIYRATAEWEGSLRVYRLALAPRARSLAAPRNPPSTSV
jgi:hypothetical protein